MHFSKIGKNISSKIDPPGTFNDFLLESFPNLCTFPLTSADEIRQIIVSLKCKTTSNSYDIPAKFLKISASNVAIGNPERRMCKASHCGSKQQ